jgi:hypothetical protein
MNVVNIVLIIVSIAIFIYGLILAVKFYKGKVALVNCFTDANCIVFGLKGAGKDLLYNKVINSRNVNCYANIPYNKELCTVKDIQDFSVSPNTFENILNNDIKIVPKINKECCDMYISDGGIFMPSQYSNQLIKNYPSLPIYYALSRHLTNSNIHINSQYLGRVWDKLREQAGYFIRAVKTTRLAIKVKDGKDKDSKKLVGFLITDFIVYDNYASAMAQLQPFDNKRLFSGAEGAATKAEFVAKHGNIKSYKVIQRISSVYYDSRYFHYLIYGYKSPDSMI